MAQDGDDDDGDDVDAREAIGMVIQLWLMTTRPGSDELRNELHVRDVVLNDFLAARTVTHVPAGASSINELKADVRGKSLEAVGGINIVYTSCLCEHLLMDENTTLRIFQHASMLRKYREDGSNEKYVLPGLIRAGCKLPLAGDGRPIDADFHMKRFIPQGRSRRNREDNSFVISDCYLWPE
jgi:hypothetical protein